MVSYPGEVLFQGIDNDVVVTLLRSEVADSTLDKYTTATPRGINRADLDHIHRKKTSGFGTPTQMHTNSKVCVREREGR